MEAIAIFSSTNIRRNSLDILKIEEYDSEYTFGFLQKIEVVFLIWVLNRKRNKGYKYVTMSVISRSLVAVGILFFCFCFVFLQFG